MCGQANELQQAKMNLFHSEVAQIYSAVPNKTEHNKQFHYYFNS